MRWLVSARYDLMWFAGPFIYALIAAQFCDSSQSESSAPPTQWVWLFAVVMIDVAHVYATLFRTYCDAHGRQQHRRHLIVVPFLAWLLASGLYLGDPLWFWRVFAYLALFHFIQQHQGFVALYQRHDPMAPRWPARTLLWISTLAPTLWWHANLPRAYAWFVADDFVAGLPIWLGQAGLVIEAFAWLIYVIARLCTAARCKINPMVDLMVLLPALTWLYGIVLINRDGAFTLTNVIPHGVAYLALVWRTGGQKNLNRWFNDNEQIGDTPIGATPIGKGQIGNGGLLLAFLAIVIGLALVEEAAWDHWLNHEHGWIFGPSSPLPLTAWQLALGVGLLMTPQVTHYLLDRWIWRPGSQNPDLAPLLPP